jgi:hypothetical protein
MLPLCNDLIILKDEENGWNLSGRIYAYQGCDPVAKYVDEVRA